MQKVSYKYKRISEIQKYFIETKAYHRYKCISKTKKYLKVKKVSHSYKHILQIQEYIKVKKYLTDTSTYRSYKCILKIKTVSLVSCICEILYLTVRYFPKTDPRQIAGSVIPSAVSAWQMLAM